jgi:hypothetical protein
VYISGRGFPMSRLTPPKQMPRRSFRTCCTVGTGSLCEWWHSTWMKAGRGTFQRRWHVKFARLQSATITNSQRGRWSFSSRTWSGRSNRRCRCGEAERSDADVEISGEIFSSLPTARLVFPQSPSVLFEATARRAPLGRATFQLRTSIDAFDLPTH